MILLNGGFTNDSATVGGISFICSILFMVYAHIKVMKTEHYEIFKENTVPKKILVYLLFFGFVIIGTIITWMISSFIGMGIVRLLSIN